MTQFKKVSCVYHPDQFITNFCKQQTCLMPLCPSCIGTHTQYHDQNGFRATYYNITDVLIETQTKIYDLMSKIEQTRKRNELVLGAIYDLPNMVHEKILIAKNQVYNAVDAALEQLQKQIILQLQKKHEENSIYSLNKIQYQQNLLKNALIQLDDMDYTLKGQKCLASVIKFFAQTQPQFNDIYQQISNQTLINQNYYPNLAINKTVIPNIKNLVGKSIRLQLNFPNKITEVIDQSRRRMIINDQQQLLHSRTNKVLSNSQIKRGFPNNNTKDLTPSKRNPVVIQQIYQQPPQFQNNNFTHSPIKQSNANKADISPIRSSVKKNSKYDEQFETLSKKLSDMRKQNEMLAKALKKA